MSKRSIPTEADILQRLADALNAIETARVLTRSTVEALELHLDQIDAELRRLAADIEGRAN